MQGSVAVRGVGPFPPIGSASTLYTIPVLVTAALYGKLGVQSRTQAALYAGRIGLVPLDQLGASEPADAGW
jgi:hypothetical protein